MLHVEKCIDDVARAYFSTCTPPPPSYSNFWSIFSQHFLQKMIRNDVLSDWKVLQRFGDIEI